jgi:peptidyl-tRNA hydrolase
MNQSGKAVSKAYKKLGGVNWGRLLVIHDDLEMAVGKVKLRTMGMGKLQYRGEADLRGHNGIRSCVETLRTEVSRREF